MSGRIGKILVFALLAGCASPSAPAGSKQQNGTEKGPGTDLAGFVSSDDLATNGSIDMTLPAQHDMASTAHDMASAPLDFSLPSGGGSCGTIDANGECDGDVLKYCGASDTLVTEDCAAEGSFCFVAFGFASCF
jgi:hypothetical protein